MSWRNVFLAYFILTVLVGSVFFISKKPEAVIESMISFVDSISSKPVEQKYTRKYTEPSAFE